VSSESSIAPVGDPQPFGIYVHWPFCAAKCPYCDFNSHVRTKIEEASWTSGILRELQWMAALQAGARPAVETIFFGGGTPSLISGVAVAAVIDEIARLWPVAPDVEITLESNPASAEAERFADYRRAGVNRLSLGVQALNDADLKFLGRLHNVAEAKSALGMACDAFEHVSLDLIYARLEQTVAAWRSELREALAFDTEHLSLYQLTIEPGTPFAALARTGVTLTPDEDSAAALYETTQELTEAAGCPAYEISNHARRGAECRHNLLYWRYGDYAGVGPGAHGRLTIEGRRIATLCEKLPERWREKIAHDGNGVAEQTEIAAEDAAREHLLMNLRLAEGLDLAEYQARWGTELDTDRITSLVDEGHLLRDANRVVVTPRGRLVLNAVIAAIAD
jgi:oxygen-independent coproporphyrinogen-3 oxidase